MDERFRGAVRAGRIGLVSDLRWAWGELPRWGRVAATRQAETRAARVRLAAAKEVTTGFGDALEPVNP